MKRKIFLQLFANPNTQTTLLNNVGTNDLAPEMKTYYDKRLIDLAGPNLVHDQFGQEKPIPKGSGKTIEFRKYDSLPKATTPLTEGVTPDGNHLNVTTITATVSQYGDYITISDMLKLTAIDNNITEALHLLGDQAGRTLDTITRDVLAGGTNVNYSGDRASRSALTAVDKLTINDIEKAATQLKAVNAPTFDGDYVAIIHPYVSYDLRTSSDWIDVHKYTDAAVDKMFEGEIGKIGNVRFVESTEAKIWKSAADNCPTYTEGTDTLYYAVFGTIVLGKNAYGKTAVEGGGLETIVKPLGAGDDPLNMRATVGWKATKVAERLVEQYMVRIESLSAYSKKAAAN
jgi:N4-gp56 family major capsid protein